MEPHPNPLHTKTKYIGVPTLSLFRYWELEGSRKISNLESDDRNKSGRSNRDWSRSGFNFRSALTKHAEIETKRDYRNSFGIRTALRFLQVKSTTAVDVEATTATNRAHPITYARQHVATREDQLTLGFPPHARIGNVSVSTTACIINRHHTFML